MLWAGSEPSRIYLGQNRVGVWSPAQGEAGVQWLSVESALEGCARGLELLRHEGHPRRQRVAVWLSGALARPFVFGPVHELRRWSEARQVAAGLAPDATGLEGPCEVWLDDWIPDKSCIAVAVNQGLRNAIEASAKSEKVRLVNIGPWWTAALNKAMKSAVPTPGIIVVDEVDSLTVMSGDSGVFVSAACYSPRPDSAQTQALLTRALMAANVAPRDGLRAMLCETTGSGGAKADEATGTPFVPFAVQLVQLT